jgi:hypothetical protein
MNKAIEVFQSNTDLVSYRLRDDLRKAAISSKVPYMEDFGRMMVNGVLQVGNRLNRQGLIDGESLPLEQALSRWIKDGEHGLYHGYYVYKGMEYIGKYDGLVNSETDMPELALRAGLHDMAEFLPLTHRGQEISPNHRSRKHPEMMGIIIEDIGKALGVSDAHQLAVDIQSHDVFYSKPTVSQMEALKRRVSIAGQLLADADRMMGSGHCDGITAIDRNRRGSLGKWYFFRDNIDNQERLKWWPRTGGLFDGLCALGLEFCAPDHWLYTERGKEINAQRRDTFPGMVKDYYSRAYVDGWQELNEAMQDDRPIMYGLRGSNNELVQTPEGDLADCRAFQQFDIRGKINTLLHTPVSAKSTTARQYFGYYLAVSGSDGIKWFDPSVLRFETVGQLQEELSQTIDGFARLLKQQTLS